MPARRHFLQPLLAPAPGPLHLCTRTGRATVATRLVTAFDSASRRRGLLGRQDLPEGEALIIAPSSAVHTFGMRFAIDVVFAARDGRILKIRREMRPKGLSASWRSFAVVELRAGTLERLNVEVGDTLVVELREA